MKPTLKCLVFLLLIFAAQKSKAQKSNESFYAFKEDWSAAPSVNSSTYFMHEIKKCDTEYVCRYYQKTGPMIKQEVYKDDGLSIPNGFFCWYNIEGNIDSAGNVINLKKDGRWTYNMSDSVTRYYEDYENGRFVKRGDFKIKDTSNTKTDTTQKAALFKNGSNAWTKYLSSHIEIPNRFQQIEKPGIYTLTVGFTINKSGKVQDVFLYKSIEWSADTMIMNVLANSPVWQPAMQKGKPVLYRQKQNISLRVTN